MDGLTNIRSGSELHIDKLVSMDTILCNLILESYGKKWNCVESCELSTMMTSAQSIANNFTVPELKIIIRVSAPSKHLKGTKSVWVNEVCRLYGYGSAIINITSVSSLRSIVLKQLSKWPKIVINILHATNSFFDENKKWDDQAPFKGSTSLVTDDGEHTIESWYAQPSNVCGEHCAIHH